MPGGFLSSCDLYFTGWAAVFWFNALLSHLIGRLSIQDVQEDGSWWWKETPRHQKSDVRRKKHQAHGPLLEKEGLRDFTLILDRRRTDRTRCRLTSCLEQLRSVSGGSTIETKLRSCRTSTSTLTEWGWPFWSILVHCVIPIIGHYVTWHSSSLVDIPKGIYHSKMTQPFLEPSLFQFLTISNQIKVMITCSICYYL